MVWYGEGGEKQPTRENGKFLLLFLEPLLLASGNSSVCITRFYHFLQQSF